MENDRLIWNHENVDEANKGVDFTIYTFITVNGVTIRDPTSKFIAHKDKRQLQIVNLESNSTLKSHVMNEDVAFWKWISEKTIGLVTKTSIYHWSIDSDASAPLKVFERDVSLQAAQVVSYKVNTENKWMALVGISRQGGRVVGNIQLYSRDRNVSELIEGHAAVFAELQLGGAPSKIKLFISAVGNVTGAKLHIVEIDYNPNPNNPPFKKEIDVFFPPEATNDFPVAMQVSTCYGIIFVLTKYGFVHLYHLETGICIDVKRISDDEEEDKFEEREEEKEGIFEETEEEGIFEERGKGEEAIFEEREEEDEEDVIFSDCDMHEMEKEEREGHKPEITRDSSDNLRPLVPDPELTLPNQTIDPPSKTQSPPITPDQHPHLTHGSSSKSWTPTLTFTTTRPSDPVSEQCEEISKRRHVDSQG